MMQSWFPEAKLGIFIHYGIYAVKGTAESWEFRKNRLTLYRPYMRQKNGFTASKYDPESWAELFKEAGARYAVLTTKHHDGFALFDSKYSDLTAAKQSPAKRDLVAPYCDALRNKGLRVGLYFSHSDWSDPDYSAKTWHRARYFIDRYLQNEKKWKRFKVKHRKQITELLHNYGKIDLLWFDGYLERGADDWEMKSLKDWLTDLSPETVINARIGSYGDYDTPEQQIPTVKPDKPWEYCMTINDNWGYRQSDKHFKSPEKIVRIFCEIVSMGGNLLLNIGPKEDGTIPVEEEIVLKRLGAFNKANEEAIWGTKAFSGEAFNGGITISKDGKKLYCFQYGVPQSSVPVFIKPEDVESISLVSNNKQLTYSCSDTAVWVQLAHEDFIEGTAVFALKLRTPLEEK